MPTKKGRGIIYARPSFLEGMARIFDFGGTLNEYDFGHREPKRDSTLSGPERESTLSGPEADAEAIRSDWQAVGDDMRAVMGRYVRLRSACEAETDEVGSGG